MFAFTSTLFVLPLCPSTSFHTDTKQQAFFSFAWNGVVWVYCSEIFPTRIKELAVCLVTAVQWLFQFAVARASPYMLSALKGGFFFFFAACITVMGVLVWWLVPETKGRSLESMDELFGSPYGVIDRVGLELKSFRRERGLGKEEEKAEVKDDGVSGSGILRADEV